MSINSSCVMAAGSGLGRMTGRSGTAHLNIQVCFSQIRSSPRNPVLLHGMAILADEITCGCCHVYVKVPVSGVCHVLPTCLRAYCCLHLRPLSGSQAGRPGRFMQCLDRLVHCNGHISGIRYHKACDRVLFPLVILLMTDETINVLQMLLLRECCIIWSLAQSNMAARTASQLPMILPQ